MATSPQKVLESTFTGDEDQTFIDEQLDWLKNHRQEMNASWSDLANWTGIPTGTLSQLVGAAGYKGNRRKYADQIATYRQTLAAQADINLDLPEKPGYFETPTSKAFTQYLHWGQRGRIVLIVSGAGLGKTQTAHQFQVNNAGTFIATMTPSTSGIMPMQQRVLKALGEKHTVGSPSQLSEMICDVLRKRKHGLLIIDEAQHLSIKALEEIRSWYDATGVGIALMGNERVQQSIDGVSRAADFAQLFSRIGLRLIRPTAMAGDAEAVAAAWGVEDPGMIDFLRQIVMRPGAIRGATFALEVAHMLAVAQNTPVNTLHLKKAFAQLSNTKVMA
ncbi:MAG: AAA family ATPase [Pseudomonadota bacterium]|nr:AAA family ATPase [Pseudomonadota bacterium]